MAWLQAKKSGETRHAGRNLVFTLTLFDIIPVCHENEAGHDGDRCQLGSLS